MNWSDYIPHLFQFLGILFMFLKSKNGIVRAINEEFVKTIHNEVLKSIQPQFDAQKKEIEEVGEKFKKLYEVMQMSANQDAETHRYISSELELIKKTIEYLDQRVQRLESK
jgi:hypothetical protein